MPAKFKTTDAQTWQRWEDLRYLFLNRIWRSMLIMVLVAVPLSISRFYFTGWLWVYSFHLLYLAIVVAINLLGARLSYRIRALLAVAMLDAAAVVGMLNFGLLSAAWIWMFLAGVLSGHFYTQKAGNWHNVLGTALVALVGYGYMGGQLHYPFDVYTYIQQPSSWLTALAGPILLTILVFHSLSIYQQAVHSLLQEIENYRAETQELAAKLSTNLAEIKKLRTLIPMCANCGKVRVDKDYWDNVEAYVRTHLDAKFSHLLCPPCGEMLYGDLWHQVMTDMANDTDLNTLQHHDCTQPKPDNNDPQPKEPPA